MRSKWYGNYFKGFMIILFSVLFSLPAAASQGGMNSGRTIKRVLLISIDGMHALDFQNCAKGIKGINGGNPYCPNLAELDENGVKYLQAYASRPSDSFPGTVALLTGATPRSSGAFYDVSYDRKLAPPKMTTPYGIPGDEPNTQFGMTNVTGYSDSCKEGVRGTQVGFDEEIDINYTELNAGGGINPDYLPRDPDNGCKPVYPDKFVRVNSIFDVVNAAGGYTAWSDKHQTYTEFSQPTDGYSPEINSIPEPLKGITANGNACFPSLPDQNEVLSSNSWTDSFQNVQCYDALKVQAVINWIDGKTHDRSSSAPVPNVMGMNFQAVSVGEKLVEKALSETGGYTDATGTPSAALLNEIEFVDSSIGEMVQELKNRGLLDSTLIIVSAKHGQSAINLKSMLRIPADNPADEAPSTALTNGGIGVAQALKDDISLIWLTDQSKTSDAVAVLSANLGTIGGGEIFSGRSLDLLFNSPLVDSRTPDIILAPNVGVVYTGGTKKVAEHGGFANDDRNVMLLVSNPRLSRSTVTNLVETRQVAPTILSALGLDPNQLQSVQLEQTAVLPGLSWVTGSVN